MAFVGCFWARPMLGELGEEGLGAEEILHWTEQTKLLMIMMMVFAFETLVGCSVGLSQSWRNPERGFTCSASPSIDHALSSLVRREMATRTTSNERKIPQLPNDSFVVPLRLS